MGEEQTDWPHVLPKLLSRAGLGGDAVAETRPLVGGVSSDIVLVRLASGREFCAKRALGRLRVAADWQAPVMRNHYEVAWLQFAADTVRGFAPEVLAEDERSGAALIAYLPPESFVPWKAELLAGRLDARVAPALGAALGTVHAASWQDATMARRFATDALFDALRLDPYLRTLARRTPDLAGPILDCLSQTSGTHLAVVHGDVSPKNVMVASADGHPVLLDAECAWYGDPAFDAAFLISHLVLKALHVPAIRDGLLVAALDFRNNWLERLPETARQAADRRAARLVGCLLLARVDGKSPVEYLDVAEQAQLRSLARPLIATPADNVGTLVARTGCGLAGMGR